MGGIGGLEETGVIDFFGIFMFHIITTATYFSYKN
jgi:hypothetical protein